MEINGEAHEEGVIESSQVPTLRKSVRMKRIFYGESNSSSTSDAKCRKRTKITHSDKATVSQYLHQEWKSPRIGKQLNTGAKGSNAAPKLAPQSEEYVKITTQHDGENGIGFNPSVDLFEQEKEVVERYVFHENTEDQQEEMLDKILQGFRTSYQEANAKLSGSRVVLASPEVEATNISSNVIEKVLDLEPDPKKLMLHEDSQREQKLKESMIANDIHPVEVDGCWDLSKKRDRSIREHPYAYRQFNTLKNNVQNNMHSTPREKMLKNCNEDILDLHNTAPLAGQRTSGNREYASHFQRQVANEAIQTVSTKESETQTSGTALTRNAGVQYRPVASFDMTKHNVINLARMVGSNPDSVYKKLKDITRTSCQSLWRVRNLSNVFSQDDPYFANLEHFMSPSYGRF